MRTGANDLRGDTWSVTHPHLDTSASPDENNEHSLARRADEKFSDIWPILTERLLLAPLQTTDADEMYLVLNDINLHTFTGGEPMMPDELKKRYARLESGSGRDSEVWVNLIARLRVDGVAIGFVQATIHEEGKRYADIAWVVGVPWQRTGYASEAATALVSWLQRQGIDHIQAHIHPDHEASMTVARRIGMHPTAIQSDGETQWQMPYAG